MKFVVKGGRNPKWVTEEHSLITLDVLFENENGELMFDGFVPFTASPDDVEEYGRQIFADCIKGVYGEIEPYVAPVIPFDEAKATKLEKLAAWFNCASANAHVMSSLGFEINTDSVAKRNVDALIEDVQEGMTDEPVPFMGYDNILHDVTLENLKTLRAEIRASGFALYQQKWAFRERIETAQTTSELDEIILPVIE